MDYARQPAEAEAKLHFLDYWRIIRIRKAVIILVFLLVSLTATFFTLIMEKYYSSTARIEVHLDTTDVGVMNSQTMTGVYDPYFIQTEFEVIRSQVVLDRVIDELKLNDVWTEKYQYPTKLKTQDTRGILRGMIDLAAVRNTSLIDITVYDRDAEEAAKLAQKVAEVYQEYRKEQWGTNLTRGFTALNREMKDLESQIQTNEGYVAYLYTNLDVNDLDPISIGPAPSLPPQTAMQLNNEKSARTTALAMLKAQLAKVGGLKPEEQRRVLPLLNPDNQLASLLEKEIDAENQLASMVRESTNNVDKMRAQALLEATEAQIADRVKGILTSMEVQIGSLDAAIASLDKSLDEAKKKDSEKARASRPYYDAKEKLERLKKLEDVLAFRVGEVEVTMEMPTFSMVKVINKAEMNPVPVRPKKGVYIPLGMIVGLLVGLGLAFFIEYLDTSVKTIDDVERTLQAPVLGVIPQNVGSLLEEGAESPHAEAYRVLRTNLLFSRKDDKLNTVAVVSAGAGEGKSTTVCNLATVFAQAGQRVLMVDSDLRRPTLHRLIKVANTLGLTNYLLKQNTLEEVIQTTSLEKLDFMASGKLPSSSLGILNSAQMKDLIGELKKRYDFVLFDSPPIMGVSDASILASEVDMTLQVIQYRRYPQPMNIRAKQLIEKVGGNLVGIVLNNINMAQDESYYYYSGYYHDYYGRGDDETPGSNGDAHEKSRLGKPKA